MARPKGKPNPNAGRPAGSPNKSTALARQAIAEFIDLNSGRLQEWLDQIALESPEKAFNAVRDLLEYHVPKLARTEITGKDGSPLLPILQDIDGSSSGLPTDKG